jgi:AraC-like DNA-binding protein
MLLDVFIDRTCGLAAEPRLRRLSPILVDATGPDTLQRLAGGGVLLIGARTSDCAAALRPVREIRSALPHVVIVLCVEWRDARRLPLSRWIRAGVDEFLTVVDSRDAGEVLRVVNMHAIAPPPAEEIRKLRLTRAGSWVREAVLFCLRNACREIHVSDLARCFGYSPRTLTDSFSADGYPGPHDVCRVGRSLGICELAERGIASPFEMALRLGFSDTTEMRKAKWRLRRSILREPAGALSRFAGGFPRLKELLHFPEGT